MINIAELLKDCPTGMELDCSIYENVTLVQVKEGYDYPIVIETPNGQMLLSKYGCFSKNELAKCIIFPKGETTWEGFVPPYEFKDGDVLAFDDETIVIFKDLYNNTSFHSYCHIEDGIFTISKEDMPDWWRTKGFYPATEEEKAKLFKAIKENGYKWNANTKTLEKLIEPTKFDITTLKPFKSEVLVRNYKSDYWKPAIFGFTEKDKNAPFYVVGGNFYYKCIPYEGNEHLLGTTDDCDDYYKL